MFFKYRFRLTIIFAFIVVLPLSSYASSNSCAEVFSKNNDSIFNNQQDIVNKTIREIENRIADPNLGAFGPESLIWKIFGERSASIALPRMGMMQLAHPEIAKYIIDNSSFKIKTLERFNATAKFLHGFVYGDLKSVKKMGKALISIHEKALKNMKISEAKMSELFVWVHLTTWESMIIGYEATVKSLSVNEKKQLYEELKVFAGILGIENKYLPSTYANFKEYMKIESSKLVLTNEVLEFANTLMGNQKVWERVIPFAPDLVSKYGKGTIVNLSNSLLPSSLQKDNYNPKSIGSKYSQNIFYLMRLAVKYLPTEIRYREAYLNAQSRVGNYNVASTQKDTHPFNPHKSNKENKDAKTIKKCPFAGFFSSK